MKIRSGFVSNSSSSSYIIDISRTLPEIINEIDPPNSFYTHDMIPKLEECIIEYKRALDETSRNALFISWAKDSYKSCIKENNDLLKLAKKAQKNPNKYDYDFIKAVLKNQRISLEERNGHTIFRYQSSIHNSFNDLGETLSAICLWYLFNHPNLIIATEVAQG